MTNSELMGLLLARMRQESAETAEAVDDHGHTTEGVASTGHADSHGSGSGGGIDFNADLTLVTILLFLALLAVLSRLAWRPILDGLDKRERSISDEIESAQRANAEAKATLQDYEQKLAAAAEQASALLAEAKKDSLAMKEQILAKANQAAQAQRERAIAEIKAAKDAAVRELAEKSAETAVGLAGSIIGRSLSSDDHRSLIDESISGFVKRV